MRDPDDALPVHPQGPELVPAGAVEVAIVAMLQLYGRRVNAGVLGQYLDVLGAVEPGDVLQVLDDWKRRPTERRPIYPDELKALVDRLAAGRVRPFALKPWEMLGQRATPAEIDDVFAEAATRPGIMRELWEERRAQHERGRDGEGAAR